MDKKPKKHLNIGKVISMKPLTISFLLLFTMMLLGCKQNKLRTLYGTWKLDSTAGPNGKLFPSYMSLHFTLLEDNTCHYYWFEGDVGDNFKGKYRLIKNPETGKLTLEFTKDTDVNEFRVYETQTILELQENRFKSTQKESYQVQDSIITFDRINIFKKL